MGCCGHRRRRVCPDLSHAAYHTGTEHKVIKSASEEDYHRENKFQGHARIAEQMGALAARLFCAHRVAISSNYYWMVLENLNYILDNALDLSFAHPQCWPSVRSFAV